MRWLKQLPTRRRRYNELSESICEHLDEKMARFNRPRFSAGRDEQGGRREFGKREPQ